MALRPTSAALASALLVFACVEPPGNGVATDATTGTTAVTATTTASSSSTSPTTGTDTTSTSGASSDTTGTTTTEVVDTTIATTNASASGGDQTATCECIIPDPIGLESFDWQTCGWGPCGTIELFCPFPADPQPYDPDAICPIGGTPHLDLEALDCSLQLLIDGTPGMVDFTELFHIPLHGGFVKIGEGRTGVSRTYVYDDIGSSDSAAEQIELKDAAYFLGCKQLADPAARYKCLKDWSAGTVLATCDEAGQQSNW